ncbi:MAG: hypothetical protein KC506_00235 [Nanoarchaeota archaeon]|nr:hypothetical protein [Nanoarchaeota archaeon]
MVAINPFPPGFKERLEEYLTIEINRKNYDGIRLIAADLYAHASADLMAEQGKIGALEKDLHNPSLSKSSELMINLAITEGKGKIRRYKSDMERYSSLAQEAYERTDVINRTEI